MKASNTATALRWPAALNRTAMRTKWFERITAMPPGLSIRELAERLDRAYPTVSFWAKLFSYRFKRMPRGRKSSVDWETADWSMKNSVLAGQLGVTSERVRQMRQQLELPPAPRCSIGGIRFRAFVHENSRRLHRWSIREMIAASGADISTATAHVILQKVGHRRNGSARRHSRARSGSIR